MSDAGFAVVVLVVFAVLDTVLNRQEPRHE